MTLTLGALISQTGPQNNDEIGDPGSPKSWGPQNFMTPGLRNNEFDGFTDGHGEVCVKVGFQLEALPDEGHV